MKRRVIFYRHWDKPLGGTNGANLKQRDCYDHFIHSSIFQPHIYFSPKIVWNDHPGNYWRDLRDDALKRFRILSTDILFFSGSDWEVLSRSFRRKPGVPILNIVHPRHARPDDKRNSYLKHPAIRIARSEQGARILEEYGVHGPIFVIPDAIDIDQIDKVEVSEKDIDILVVGLKQPRLAKEIAAKLDNWSANLDRKLNIYTQLPPKLPTRMEFIRLLKRSRVVICLPVSSSKGYEGFYLPPLEAMAAGCLVICPPAVGNLAHCIDGYNCLMPAYTVDAITDCAILMWQKGPEEKQRLIDNGREVAWQHSLEKERESLLNLLHQADHLWSSHFQMKKRSFWFLKT